MKIVNAIVQLSKDILSKNPKYPYKIINKRLGFRYQDVGHGSGALIWWVDKNGKMKIVKSTGKETHHQLDKKINMDDVWRGRLEPGGIATILPPVRVYAKPYDTKPPRGVLVRLESMGAKTIVVDTQYGLRQVAKIEKNLP